MVQDMVKKDSTNLERLQRLYSDLDALGQYCPMPTDAMNAIGDAASIISKAIIEAPVTCERDIAAKFRHAAELIEDESGIMSDEPSAALGAIEDLIEFRRQEWLADFGRPCPLYAA